MSAPLGQEEAKLAMQRSVQSPRAAGVCGSALGFSRSPSWPTYTVGEQHGVTSFVFWNLGCQQGSTSYEVSPLTPGVWQVIQRHAPNGPTPWSESIPAC